MHRPAINRAGLAGIVALVALAVISSGLLGGCAGIRRERVYASAVVAADHADASQAGAEILRAGGNAVDAAVATSFALSVVRPYSCGIGGGGFMIVYLREHPDHDGPVVTAVNYREMAPGAAGPDYFERMDDPNASTRGGAAVGVPGTVAGLLHALERYGTLDRRRVLAPAIRLAERGFIADDDYAGSAGEIIRWIDAEPERRTRFARIRDSYLGGGDVRTGDRILVPEQAIVLRAIAEQGIDGFYDGPVADAIVRSVQEAGGHMTPADLASYRVSETPPLVGAFAGRTLLTMPPPSSGGLAMIQMLTILDEIGAAGDLPADSAPYIHRVAESMKHAFADRARWLADPAFVPVPVKELLDPVYLAGRAGTFEPDRTLPQDAYGTPTVTVEDGGTSHLSVVDRWGNAVACTETINLTFGSLVAVDGFGFVLNDEMDDFLARRGEVNAFGLAQSEANLPAPGKRPLSSMSPTIVLDGPLSALPDVEVVAGASGGPRIITATTQAILRVLLFDDGASEAVGAARFHHQWVPDRLDLEPALRRRSDLVRSLERRGHTIGTRNGVGVVQLIRRARGDRDGWEARSDPRKGGRPAGM